MADLQPLTPAQPSQSAQPGPNSTAAGVLDAEALRYALKAWLREEGFYDVKVREMACRFMWNARFPFLHI
jgi:hypothetical protein